MTAGASQQRSKGAGEVRWWQWTGLGLITLALMVALVGHGGRDLTEWSLSLILIALAGLVCWLATSRPATGSGTLGILALSIPAWAAIQLVPLPLFLLRLLSPNRARILDALGPVSPVPLFAALSIDPAATAQHLLRAMSCVVVFLLVRQIALRTGRYWLVAAPLVAIGALEAILGIAQAGSGAQELGSFRNKNHFAGLLEMTLPLAIGCAVSRLKNSSPRRRSGRARMVTGVGMLVAALLMLFAFATTLSRMGFVSALGGLFCMAAAAITANLRGRARIASLGVLAAVFVTAALAVPSGALANAFGESLADRTAEGRLPIWSDALRLLAAYPLAGSGFGTFQTAFLPFQTGVVDFVFEFAHNDYLEAATELGIVGFAALAVFMTRLFAATIRASRADAGSQYRYVAWGTTGALAAIGIHSLADFNLYIPANAIVLAWILGIVAAFTGGSGAHGRAADHPPEPAVLRLLRARGIPVALAFALLIFGAAWYAFETGNPADAVSEAFFCHIGICDTQSWVSVVAAKQSGTAGAVPQDELLRALLREPASPYRWLDLGDALLRAGRADRARYAYLRALQLAPYIPPVAFKVAEYYAGTGERDREYQLTSLVLARSTQYDNQIFARYEQDHLTAAEVLSRGMPAEKRAAQSWLSHQLLPGSANNARLTWEWMMLHRLADENAARSYVNFLYASHSYEEAAQAWARYRDHRGGGFLESSWLVNGDFESDPTNLSFDWIIDNSSPDAAATIDPTVAHTGSRSFRLAFSGKSNADYSNTSQTAFLLPGSYRFTAFVKTRGITTDQGIGFHLFDAEVPTRLHVDTERITGTSDWRPVSVTFEVPQMTRLVTIQVVRQPSVRLDHNIAGTVWIDTVTLSRMN